MNMSTNDRATRIAIAYCHNTRDELNIDVASPRGQVLIQLIQDAIEGKEMPSNEVGQTIGKTFAGRLSIVFGTVIDGDVLGTAIDDDLICQTSARSLRSVCDKCNVSTSKCRTARLLRGLEVC